MLTFGGQCTCPGQGRPRDQPTTTLKCVLAEADPDMVAIFLSRPNLVLAPHDFDESYPQHINVLLSQHILRFPRLAKTNRKAKGIVSLSGFGLATTWDAAKTKKLHPLYRRRRLTQRRCLPSLLPPCKLCISTNMVSLMITSSWVLCRYPNQAMVKC